LARDNLRDELMNYLAEMVQANRAAQ